METKHGENKMTRDEYLEALLPAARQATTHFVGTERERRARAMLDECTDSELLVMYNKQVVSGSIKPHTPALTHEQVERERLRGQQELLKLREDYAEKLAIRRAEEDADRILFQRAAYEADAPVRKQALIRAREVIKNAQAALRNFALNEANVNVILSALGTDLSVYEISQAIDSHAVSLTPPTSEEQEAWRLADIERHNRELQELSIPELKRRVREERSVNVAAASEKQNREALEAQQQRDQDYGGYPPLPTHTPEGQPIDAQFLKKMCNTDLPRYKFYLKKYSASALTARLQGRQ